MISDSGEDEKGDATNNDMRRIYSEHGQVLFINASDLQAQPNGLSLRVEYKPEETQQCLWLAQESNR